MIREFTKFIQDGQRFAFTKFGDSELFCMQGREGGNGDGHPFSLKLKHKLNYAYDFLAAGPNSYFAEWIGDGKEVYQLSTIQPKFVDYETLLPTVFNPDLEGLKEFYSAIKNSRQKKIYVAPERSRPVIDLLAIDTFIEVPLFNCFESYNEILAKLQSELKAGAIVLFSCTMLANVLIADIYSPTVTCLDCGSAFDPYCGILNRDRQMTIEQAKEYFSNI